MNAKKNKSTTRCLDSVPSAGAGAELGIYTKADGTRFPRRSYRNDQE